VFGLDPARDEVDVKSRFAYVPDTVAFYPWMTVRDTLNYVASFRRRWNAETEAALLDRFQLNVWQKTSYLSKGQRTQLALTAAICGEPELLVLDEPTSGLDPIVRREFIQTVIGAFQDADPGRRTVFVSTHLIAEFEGLIDQFTIIDHGRDVLTLGADTARERYQKIHARFATAPTSLNVGDARLLRQRGREVELFVNGNAADVLGRLRAQSPESLTTESLTLEEIFVNTLQPQMAAV
jgi:ABC-2 type transport system ATP-binding protein